MLSTEIRLFLAPVTRRILWMGSVWMIAAMISLIGLVMPNVIEADGPAAAYLFGDQIKPLLDDDVPIIYGPTGSAIASIGGGGLEWAVSDHLGSVRIKAERSHEYGPFGSVSSSDSVPVYAGHPYDPHPGIYQTPGRTYDPSSGRFLSTDPGRQGASPYPYAGNNPIANVDRLGNIYVPFYIRSGFNAGYVSTGSARRDVSWMSQQAQLIHSIIAGANEPEQRVLPDELFFSRSEDERPGSRFSSWGRTFVQHEFYAGGAMVPQHGDNVYWIVGGEIPVQRPMDVAEVFQSWRALRPDLANNIVVVDITGDRNASAPIRQALDTAGIVHGFVRTQPDRHSNMFIVDGGHYDRASFREYVRSTTEALAGHRRALGQRVIQRLMSQQPEASQPPPRRPPYHAQTASDRLPDQTVPEVVPDLLEGATGLGDFGER